jgi:mannose-6-phosphate isomerase
MSIEKVKKPWGSYENLLDSEECKVKKIIVSPDHRPSYQYHFKRSEIWIVVSGSGTVTIDDKDSDVSEGSVVKVPKLSRHRIKNTGEKDLIFIEVQLGSYFGEDDIVRVSDDYKR